MANITLKIDDAILKKARELALMKKTSINAIIKEKLKEFVSRNSDREEAIKGMDEFFKRSRARIGKVNWHRDDIHDR